MQSFLEEVADRILQSQTSTDDLVIILPSKRAGTFLKGYISERVRSPVFSPVFYSTEDFVMQVSGLDYAPNTQLHFELYQAYLESNPENPDSFFEFCKWGPTLLQDINELDRYLIPPGKFFSYLADVRKLEQWTLNSRKTALVENYIRFWNTLEPIYHRFRERLLRIRMGYQGMVYRKACDELENYIAANPGKNHIFVGFNALNKAESTIIQNILDKGKGEIYWDIDASFLHDPVHDAGYFIRRHSKSWPCLAGKSLEGISRHYSEPKNIQITTVPKNVTQMKYVGTLLDGLNARQFGELGNTAVILGDEKLLNPLLHSMPEGIDAVNITMGFRLGDTPLATLFSQYFEFFISKGAHGWFYKNVLALLSNPFIETLLRVNTKNFARVIQDLIRERNWVYITKDKLRSVDGVPDELMLLIFPQQAINPSNFISWCQKLIAALRPSYEHISQSMVLEQLYRFYRLFNQLESHIDQYGFIRDLKSLHSLYQTLLSSETMDFRGEPLEGLQIMGMLESRNLDFETVVITSVNEGILPSGKSNNSFIPFDLKREFGLPTYKEKDAVYTYHFYRLLQRAKNIYLIYNSEPDVLEGGEKSRLISQLLADPGKSGQIREVIATPEIIPNIREIRSISKDPLIMEKLRARAESGFSPSSLTNYVRNPIDFYKKSILGINETLEVDETITASVFGTVVHGALEELYSPFLGQYLNAGMLQSIRAKIKKAVQSHFERAYSNADISIGKNVIAYNVIVRYLERLLEMELRIIDKKRIKLLGLEQKLKVSLSIPGLDFPLYLKGIIDRVDECDGHIRIIDYKTGNTALSNVEISDWEELRTNYDRSKAFQLLTYSYMYQEDRGTETLEAGIISLKSINSGLLNFATKMAGSRSKDRVINEAVLERYRSVLELLLLEIFDPEQPFTEKIV